MTSVCRSVSSHTERQDVRCQNYKSPLTVKYFTVDTKSSDGKRVILGLAPWISIEGYKASH